jgi:hypothetical protein
MEATMRTPEEWREHSERAAYLNAPPWERFFINRLRKAVGEPPLRRQAALQAERDFYRRPKPS